MYELRALSENVVREHGETLEVHPPTPIQNEAAMHGCKVEATNTTNVGNTSKTYVVKDLQLLMETQSNAEHSVSMHAYVHVGSAWYILMIQDKTLQDLPSQVELDWQDSVSFLINLSFNAAQNLAENLDVVGKSQTAELSVVVAVGTFAEVS